jgi:membrane protease YdiL (CAAX protease family)
MHLEPGWEDRGRSHRVAGWILAAAAIYPALFTWLYFITLAESPTALQQTVYVLGKLLQFALPAVWAKAAWGLAIWPSRAWLAQFPRPNATDLCGGLLSGAGCFAVIVLCYFLWVKPWGMQAVAATPVSEKLAAFSIDTPGEFIALGSFYALCHSLLEEYYWRWFVFGGLRAKWPFLPAVALASAAFTAHHLIILAAYLGWWHWAAWCGAAAVGVAGGLWAWLYQRHGSLYGPWLSHLLADAAIFLVAADLIGLGAT